ncbi:MAG: SDR family NAD(P)-dependent oxidoreductase [Methylococcales bacterium]|nr:SDR family NAD(P)-dependent oxidoreductase [Methylococcales bacterium]
MKIYKEKYGPWALVTGASTGIGKAIAYELASHGLNIVAVARRQPLLNELQQKLTNKYGIEVRIICADLASAESTQLLEQMTQALEIGLIVPNAGVGMTGKFIDSNIEDNNQLLHLNMQSPIDIFPK